MNKITGRQFSLLLISIIFFCLLLIITPFGNKLLIPILEKSIPSLKVELNQGSIFFSPHFSKINYANDDIEINALDVNVDWKLSCLWHSSICFNASSIDNLSIRLIDKVISEDNTIESTKNTQNTTNNKSISFFIDNLSVKKFTLTNQHLAIKATTVNTSFSLLSKDLMIEHLNTQSLIINNASSNKNDVTDETLINKIHSIQNSISDVVKTVMPINISINNSLIEQLKYQNDASIKTSSTLKPNDTLFQLDNLTIAFSQIKQEINNIVISAIKEKNIFQLDGTLNLVSEIDHMLSLSVKTDNDDVGKNEILINSIGNVSNLKFNAQSNGNINGNMSGNMSLIQDLIPLTLTGTWQPFLLEPLSLKVSEGDVTLIGDLSHLALQLKTTLTSPDFPAIEGVVKGVVSQHHISLDKTQLSLLNGDIELNGEIQWNKAFTLTTRVDFKDIQPHDFWPSYQADLTGQFNAALDLNPKWKAKLSDININGELFKEQVKLTGNVTGNIAKNSHNGINNRWGDWKFDDVVLKHAQNYLTINGQLAKKTKLKAIISAEDIGMSLAQFTSNTPGIVKGEASLVGDIDTLLFSTTLNAKDISYQSQKSSSEMSQELSQELPLKLSFKKGVLVASSTLSAALPFDLKLTATQINYDGQLHNSSLAASLVGNKANHLFKISVTPNLSLEHMIEPVLNHVTKNQPDKSGSIELSGQYSNSQWLGSVTSAKLTNHKQQIILDSPFSITTNFNKKSVNITNHCWSAKLNISSTQSSLCLTSPFNIDTKKMRSNEAIIKLSNFSMTQLQPYLPTQYQVSGEVNGDLSFQIFNADKLSLSSKLQWLNGAINSEFDDSIVEHQITKLTVDTSIDRQFANIIAHISSPTLGIIDASVVSNIFDEKPFINGHIRSNGLELAPYRLFFKDLSLLDGQINISAGFSGDKEQQQIFGQLNSTDITIASELLPSKIDNLKTQLDFYGDNATFNSSFNLANGQGTVNGNASWAQKLQAQFTLWGDSLALTPQKGIDVIVSPNLTLDLTPNKAIIRGNLNVDKATVKITSLPDQAISLSDDVIVKQAKNSKLKSINGTTGTSNSLLLDIDVHTLLGKQLNIDAFGLKSYVQGDLNIIQNDKVPLSTYGELTLVDAKYKAFGQNLEIETGKLVFTGAISNPVLNIKAIRDPQETEDDVIVGVNINGELENPELTIFSIPVMEKQQSLSYLMRGYSVNNEEEFGSDMAIALIVNSGLSGASNIIDDLGNAVGINNFNVTTSGSGDATRVKFSGSIGPNLQLRYGVGVFDALPEVGLRYKINKQLFIEFINDTDQALDILYQFSFD